MSEVRKCFKSRFPNGYLVEADFSQLEVVVQAMLTMSPKLIDDIASGRDMHKERAAMMFGKPVADVTKKERQIAKACSFQLAYGAGYKSMAKKLKVPESLTKKFVNDFFDRYPEIRRHNTMNMEAIEASSTPSAVYDKTGRQLRRGYMTTALNHKFSFLQKEFMGEYTFSPTDVSNYWIQGTAADLVAVFRAKMYRGLVSMGVDAHGIIPICTVHDSIVFDCSNTERVKMVSTLMDCLLSNFNELLRELFPTLKTPLQLKMDVKFGKDWRDQTTLVTLPTGEF